MSDFGDLSLISHWKARAETAEARCARLEKATQLVSCPYCGAKSGKEAEEMCIPQGDSCIAEDIGLGAMWDTLSDTAPIEQEGK